MCSNIYLGSSMRFYFDYFYYRVYKLFINYKSDGGSRALVFISLIQTFLILAIIEFYFIIFARNSLVEFKRYIPSLIVFLVFILCVVNYFKYRGRYKEFDEFCRADSKSNKRIKGILMVLTVVLTFLIYNYANVKFFQIANAGSV